jgi:hypothetical protein
VTRATTNTLGRTDVDAAAVATGGVTGAHGNLSGEPRSACFGCPHDQITAGGRRTRTSSDADATTRALGIRGRTGSDDQLATSAAVAGASADVDVPASAALALAGTDVDTTAVAAGGITSA